MQKHYSNECFPPKVLLEHVVMTLSLYMLQSLLWRAIIEGQLIAFHGMHYIGSKQTLGIKRSPQLCPLHIFIIAVHIHSITLCKY